MTTSRTFRADVIADDKDGKPVLLVEVKSRPVDDPRPADLPGYFPWPGRDEVVGKLSEDLHATPEGVKFAMLVDPKIIQVYQRGSGRSINPVLQLSAPEVLRPYDPEFTGKPIYHDYLETLAEGWLRDLAYHWKSNTPPAADDLERIGLLGLLKDGSTRREAEVAGAEA